MNRNLLEALMTGYRAILEAQDAGMKKLEAYLNKQRDADIKDDDGYLTTAKKAYNYFENARMVADHWAVHFTSEEVYPSGIPLLRPGRQGTAPGNRQWPCSGGCRTPAGPY